MRRAVQILSVLILTTIAAPTTAAAATWSAPVNVSSSSTFVDNPFIGFGRSGVGLAAWRWQDGIGNGARGGLRVASESVSGEFSPEREARDGGSPVLYGKSRVVLAGEQTILRRHASPLTRIRIWFGRTDGSFGPPRTIDTVQLLRTPAVAANDTGTVAVAYVRMTRGRHRSAKLIIRRRKRFGRPRIVSRRGGVSAVTVAVGSGGEVAVAWARGSLIEARIWRRGHALGPVVRVGRNPNGAVPTLHAAVAASGRVWIAWSSQTLSEGGDNGPFTLQVALSSKRGLRFHRPKLLDRYERRANDEATFGLALDGNDNGFVAWSSFDGSNFRARLAFADSDGRFIRHGTLSQPGYDAAVSDLATTRQIGEALVVWARLDAVGEVGTAVVAGYRPPTGGYSGEEQVSRGDRARKPAAAFNPRTGLPTVVWSQREGPDGPGIPLGQVSAFLRASIRTP